jgi:hypothetical protein
VTSRILILACIFLAFLLGLILGTVFYPQVKDIVAVRDPVALSIEHNLTIMTVGKPAFDGEKTTVTHMFKGKPNHVYSIEHTSDLLNGWENGDKHHTTTDGVFHATFDKVGNHLENWSQKMFFRVSEISKPENTLLVNK